MSDVAGERHHPATPARRERARRDGEFAKSQELAASLQMLGAVTVAYLLFEPVADWLSHTTTTAWSAPVELDASATSITEQIGKVMIGSLGVLVPVFLLLMLFGIGSHWIQTGPVMLNRSCSPDFSRMSPFQWIRRLGSPRTWLFPLVSLPKALLAIVVMGISCWMSREQIFGLVTLPADEMVAGMFSQVLKSCTQVAVVLFVTSLLDYGLVWWQHQNRLRMSDQELRDEMRMQNGNPEINARIRSRQGLG